MVTQHLPSQAPSFGQTEGFLADCCWPPLTAVPCQRSWGAGLALAQGADEQLGSPGKHLLGSSNEDVLGSAGHRFLETGLIVQPDLVSVRPLLQSQSTGIRDGDALSQLC